MEVKQRPKSLKSKIVEILDKPQLSWPSLSSYLNISLLYKS